MTTSPDPIATFLSTLSSLPPGAPTVCEGWTAHEIAAHLAAGIEEVAELIEDTVDGRPSRPTRGFEEREAPYRAMTDDAAREALEKIVDRAGAALGRQAEQGVDVTFFDRDWSAEELQVHAANEFAVHRWDMIGDDPLGDGFMSPLYVTESAIKTLNLLAVLEEGPTARARRHGLTDVRLILRCATQPDIAYTVSPDGSARFELAEEGQVLEGDVVVSSDAVNRLLTLWGRRSALREISVSGDPLLWPAVAATLWEGKQGSSPLALA